MSDKNLRKRLEKMIEEPKLFYEAWLALGPEKAAEYIALRMDLSAHRQEKLVLILKSQPETL